MSKLSEIELNKENYKLYFDPRLPRGVAHCIMAGWAGVIVQWILYFSGKITPFDNWFLGGAIFCTLLVAGLTLLHWHNLKHNYAFTKEITKNDIRKALAEKRRLQAS